VSTRPKVAVVGIDGFSPVLMDRLVQARRVPAISSLSDGVSARVVPTLPATTPVGWASMMTGASPAVTGIEGFLVHQPGDPLDERVSGCYS
jgi:predicted AlkP superfamily phosphohydrolase/phosphomutase